MGQKWAGAEIVGVPRVGRADKWLDLVASVEGSRTRAQGAKERHPSVSAASPRKSARKSAAKEEKKSVAKKTGAKAPAKKKR